MYVATTSIWVLRSQGSIRWNTMVTAILSHHHLPLDVREAQLLCIYDTDVMSKIVSRRLDIGRL